MAIRVMTPDLAKPSGGIKVMYRFVEHLCALGHDARIWHGTPGFAFDDWSTTAPVETGTSLVFEPGDVLVMTEVGRWDFLAGGQPIVMLCQGVDFVFASSDFLLDEVGGYPGWPSATAAVATSHSIHAFLSAACDDGFPVHHVPLEIEDYFSPLDKRRQIALMPRRRREDLLATIHLVRRSGQLGDWDVVLIDGMTQGEVATALGTSAIFLFGGEREGFGLPGAEAMAAGCYVVGFTGDGAKEYMLEGHSSPVPESDCVRAAEEVLRAMRWFDEDPLTWQSKTNAAREFISTHYNAARSREGLGTAFDAILAPESRSRFTARTVVQHYQAHAPADDPWNRARVAARSAGGWVRNRVGEVYRARSAPRS